MHKALSLCAFLAIVVASYTSALAASTKQTIAIQPLGTFDAKLIDAVKKQLVTKYGVEVIIKPSCPLPQEAYYPKRARYRAEKLLDFLNCKDTAATKVLGLTTVDISTTKGIYPDWGILGQGQMNGRPCVVSTFRMKGTTTKVSDEVFRARFAKVVAHEIGHTYGLDHCPNKGCLMEDAKGTVKTVDTETDFCPSCKARLMQVLRPR